MDLKKVKKVGHTTIVVVGISAFIFLMLCVYRNYHIDSARSSWNRIIYVIDSGGVVDIDFSMVGVDGQLAMAWCGRSDLGITIERLKNLRLKNRMNFNYLSQPRPKWLGVQKNYVRRYNGRSAWPVQMIPFEEWKQDNSR